MTPILRNGMRPVHPGEVLREEFLVPLGITAAQLARSLNVEPNTVEEIAAEKPAISPDMAKRLADHFDISEAFWNGLQADYDAKTASAS